MAHKSLTFGFGSNFGVKVAIANGLWQDTKFTGERFKHLVSIGWYEHPEVPLSWVFSIVVLFLKLDIGVSFLTAPKPQDKRKA